MKLRLREPRLPRFRHARMRCIENVWSRRRGSNPGPPSYQEGALPGLSYDDVVRVGGLEPPGGMQSRRVWACCVYQTSPHARGAVDAIRTRIVDGEGVVSWNQLEDHGIMEMSWSGKSDSNARPTRPPAACATWLRHCPMVSAAGVEPAAVSLRARCFAFQLRRLARLVGEGGIEPPTPVMDRVYSAVRASQYSRLTRGLVGKDRTCDFHIPNVALYR